MIVPPRPRGPCRTAAAPSRTINVVYVVHSIVDIIHIYIVDVAWTVPDIDVIADIGAVADAPWVASDVGTIPDVSGSVTDPGSISRSGPVADPRTVSGSRPVALTDAARKVRSAATLGNLWAVAWSDPREVPRTLGHVGSGSGAGHLRSRAWDVERRSAVERWHASWVGSARSESSSSSSSTSPKPTAASATAESSTAATSSTSATTSAATACQYVASGERDCEACCQDNLDRSVHREVLPVSAA